MLAATCNGGFVTRPQTRIYTLTYTQALQTWASDSPGYALGARLWICLGVVVWGLLDLGLAGVSGL